MKAAFRIARELVANELTKWYEWLSSTRNDQQSFRSMWICLLSVLILISRDGNYRLNFVDIIASLKWCGMDVPHQLNNYLGLFHVCFWAAYQVFCFLLVPWCFVRFLFGQSIAEYGMKRTLSLAKCQPYVLLYVLIAPLLFAMSFDPRFQASYPYLRPEWYHTGASEQPYFFLHLCVWEIFNSIHFLALEFFFRGFMLWGIRRAIGDAAIVFAAVPYCMIHFGKPIEEVVVSLFAGIVLGALSIRSGSILPGAILHVAFALTMDAFVLINR